MNKAEQKEHWDRIYKTKRMDEFSWFQPVPETSLTLIGKLGLDRDAHIIDVGGGDSYLTDHLLDTGYENLSLLDISSEAIARAKNRHGAKGRRMKYLVNDVLDYQPSPSVDLWHDRAVLHFLTTDDAVSRYVDIVRKSVRPGGYVIIGVFSTDGPKKCSGIEIRQYNEASISRLLGEPFDVVENFRSDHQTPFNTIQNFIFCIYRKKI